MEWRELSSSLTVEEECLEKYDRKLYLQIELKKEEIEIEPEKRIDLMTDLMF
jgi:hypothetical protein